VTEVHITQVAHRSRRMGVLREKELLERAKTYRDMANQARDPRLQLDFFERAERYETAVMALRRAQPARAAS
jgi:hypothetical protein